MYYYNSNITSDQFSLDLPSGNFSISWILKPTSRTACQSALILDSNDSNGLIVGQGGSAGENGFWRKINDYSTLPKTILNAETKVTYTYIDGVHTFGWGSNSISHNSTSVFKIVGAMLNNNLMKDFTVHEL